jgi:hypothetical protein
MLARTALAQDSVTCSLKEFFMYEPGITTKLSLTNQGAEDFAGSFDIAHAQVTVAIETGADAIRGGRFQTITLHVKPTEGEWKGVRLSAENALHLGADQMRLVEGQAILQTYDVQSGAKLAYGIECPVN